MYAGVRILQNTPETNITLANYISIKKEMEALWLNGKELFQANAGDSGSISGPENSTCVEQLSLSATTREPKL